MNPRKFFLLTLVLVIAGSLVFSVFALGRAASPSQPAGQDTPAPTPAPAQAASGLSAKLAPSIQPEAVSPAAPLVIQFSQPMAAPLATLAAPTATLTATLTGTISAQPALLTLPYVPGDIRWNDTYTELTFSPRQAFTPDTDYLVFLDGDLRSASGEGFSQPQQWEIHTIMPPRVVKRTPAQVGIERSEMAIQLAFDREMDTESVALAIQPTLPYSLSWKNDKELTIHLLAPMAYAARYRFTLAGAAQDAEGISLRDDYAWEYWTEDFDLQLAPENHLIVDQLRLKFSHDLDGAKSGQPFTIDPPVSGAWEWSGKREVTFKASEPFASGMWYSLQVSGTLVDTYGTPITVTQPISFHARPPVDLVVPGNNQSVECKTVRIHFQRPVDQASVEEAFEVSPALEGAFGWFTDTLVFTPTAWVDAYNQLYQASLQTGALDETGQPLLAAPYTWAFTCEENPTGHIWYYGDSLFGSGPNIQVLDAEGRRALQFGYLYGSTDATVTFRLYRLEVEEFVARYTSEDWFAELPEAPFKTWQDPLQQEVQELFIPESVPTGLYILEATVEENQNPDRKSQDFLLLDLTKHTLPLK